MDLNFKKSLYYWNNNHANNNCLYRIALSIQAQLFVPPQGECPKQGTQDSCVCLRASWIRVVLCVHDSAQTASHICTYVVPINCIIIVDVQDTFHFDLDLISDPGQGHKNLSFYLHVLFTTEYSRGGAIGWRVWPVIERSLVQIPTEATISGWTHTLRFVSRYHLLSFIKTNVVGTNMSHVRPVCC